MFVLFSFYFAKTESQGKLKGKESHGQRKLKKFLICANVTEIIGK